MPNTTSTSVSQGFLHDQLHTSPNQLINNVIGSSIGWWITDALNLDGMILNANDNQWIAALKMGVLGTGISTGVAAVRQMYPFLNLELLPS